MAYVAAKWSAPVQSCSTLAQTWQARVPARCNIFGSVSYHSGRILAVADVKEYPRHVPICRVAALCLLCTPHPSVLHIPLLLSCHAKSAPSNHNLSNPIAVIFEQVSRLLQILTHSQTIPTLAPSVMSYEPTNHSAAKMCLCYSHDTFYDPSDCCAACCTGNS